MTGTRIKPTLCFIVPSVAEMGGAVRVCANVASGLSSSYDVIFLGLHDGPAPLCAFPLDPAVTCTGLDFPRVRFRELPATCADGVARFLDGHDVDIAFFVSAYTAFACRRAIRASSRPAVFCDHGALDNEWSNRATTLMRFLAARACTRIVVLTDRTAESYARRLHIRRDKLVTIPNWIDPACLKRARPYDPASRKLLWAGRIDGEKGWDMLVDIAKRVLPLRPDWTWDVYGASVLSDDEERFRQAITDSELDGLLVWKHEVDDLYDRYGDYAVCTLTSYREGFPLILLEAKANHLPCVCFDVVTGPREIIDEGEDGILVPPYDTDAFATALLDLMDDTPRRVRMAEHAATGVERLSEPVVARLWMDLISSLTKPRPEAEAVR